ncbi:hypothetical protein HPP92_028912 [Vanilla planifolia]|uniref:Uncharacterized protein n=1 Tax=Vanilla planifolia TaxID=51239 RepID=A0A835P3N8_VANPL|nr:hypothetical protein HPP92_028912 [Vanilla planifolia]KAG0446315.1 hypothetical protein HPP92_028902 [Vanilla planifolia]
MAEECGRAFVAKMRITQMLNLCRRGPTSIHGGHKGCGSRCHARADARRVPVLANKVGLRRWMIWRIFVVAGEDFEPPQFRNGARTLSTAVEAVSDRGVGLKFAWVAAGSPVGVESANGTSWSGSSVRP